MRFLEDKEVVLGVSGGIAAYRAADLCRLLGQEGARVQVIMTQKAQEFITPLTLGSLTGQPVLTEMFQPLNPRPYHIDVARKAQLFLIAPATANVIARLAAGMADDLLTATALAVDCPRLLAPAMNANMYKNPAVQENLALLSRRGWVIVEPEEGPLLSGAVGKGRLARLEKILAYCRRSLAPKDYEGLKVLVTAGGTREPLDPVRYIGNYSSGKMGHALAQAAWERGAQVTLVTASQLPVPYGVEAVWVETAGEMKREVEERFPHVHIVIKAAAVGDFTPDSVHSQKIKRKGGEWNLRLVPTPDILAALGRNKSYQIVVGFAAETENMVENALKKLREKGLDMIVANDVSSPEGGFGSDYNKVTIITSEGYREELPLLPKLEVAHAVLNAIITLSRFRSLASRKEE
ncbi:MAG TPA: bifunctional phosphopantothenoylcysteine decarboxylase/phosphopantothenate--cysteine ligase CoaBC [Moorella mulderi]|nr:bifunctional phosphopantothenoylcysteine decarboxylase/phosphopantothenate--cysteine ligase CoaBC [Moorella mulderi]